MVLHQPGRGERVREIDGKKLKTRLLQRPDKRLGPVCDQRGIVGQPPLRGLDRKLPQRGEADEKLIGAIAYRFARFLAERLRLVLEPDERVGVEEVAGHCVSYSLGSS